MSFEHKVSSIEHDCEVMPEVSVSESGQDGCSLGSLNAGEELELLSLPHEKYGSMVMRRSCMVMWYAGCSRTTTDLVSL